MAAFRAPVDLDEVRHSALQGETHADWTPAMCDELERLRWQVDDRQDEAVDRRLTRLLLVLGGAAFGVALAGVALWVAS